jgi:hypothetical protein
MGPIKAERGAKTSLEFGLVSPGSGSPTPPSFALAGTWPPAGFRLHPSYFQGAYKREPSSGTVSPSVFFDTGGNGHFPSRAAAEAARSSGQ